MLQLNQKLLGNLARQACFLQRAEDVGVAKITRHREFLGAFGRRVSCHPADLPQRFIDGFDALAAAKMHAFYLE